MTKNQSILRPAHILAIAMIAALALTAFTAYADEGQRGEGGDRDHEGKAEIKFFANLNARDKDVEDARVRIEDNNVRVEGARVTATSTSGFTATSAQNSLTFNVETDASTKIEVKGLGRTTLADIAIGDTVNFRGLILSGTTTPTLTVKATKVEDKTLHRHAAAQATTTATTTAQVQIDALRHLIDRIQALIDFLLGRR